jgi:hypothetical protein
MFSKFLAKDSVRAAGLLLLIIVILFSAVFFKGYIFGGGDTTAAKGMTNQLNLHLQETGEYPLWQPFIFSGMPAFSSMMFTKWVYFPNFIFSLFHKIGIPALWTMLLHYLLAGMGVYTLLRYIKADFWSALLSGIAYMLAPFFIVMISAGHGSQMMTAAYLPWLIYAIKRVFDEPDLKALLILAVIAGLQFQRGHVQIAYYGWMAAGWYVVIETIFRLREKRWDNYLKSMGFLVAGMLFGIGLAAVLYIPSLSYAAHSIRGGSAGGGLDYGYATSWSFPPYEMLALMFSDWFGFGSQTYWGGKPFTEHSDYLGLVLILLASLAFLSKEHIKEKIFLATTIFLALLVSYGSYWPYLYDLLFKILPFFNKFRVPSMILILLELMVAILAGLGLFTLIRLSDERKKALAKPLFIVACSFGGLVVLVLLAKGMVTSMFASYLANSPKAHPQLVDLRIDMFYASLIKSLLLGGLASFSIWAYVAGKLKPTLLSIGLVAMVLIDLGHVDLRFTGHAVSKSRSQAGEQETPAIRKLKQLTQTNPGRIFPVHNLFGSNIWALHGLESIGGYSPAKLKILQDFLNSTRLEQTFLPKYYAESSQGAVPRDIADVDPQLRKRHLDVLRDLNVKYLVSPYPLNDPLFLQVDRSLHLIRGQRAQVYIYEFADAYDRAWFVPQIKTFDDLAALSQDMDLSEREPKEMAWVLDPENKLRSGDFAVGNIEVIGRGYHSLSLRTSNPGEGFLVVSEVYYPEWVAYLDGDPLEYYLVNELIRGLIVPAGEHEVRFEFKPTPIRIGFWITLVSSLILLGLGGYLFYAHRRKIAEA